VDLGWDAVAHPSRALRGGARAGGSRASPTTAIIGSQSIKGAKRGSSLDRQGFDAGKKITGRKRHILVGTLGLLLSVAVHAADIQDRDAVGLVLDRRTRRLFPFIARIYGDGGYQGPKAARAAAETGSWIIEIIARSATVIGFEVLPQAVDYRTYICMAQPVPTPRARFRALRQDRRRFRTPRHDPHHAQRLAANPSS
jgi:hypothetical protein